MNLSLKFSWLALSLLLTAPTIRAQSRPALKSTTSYGVLNVPSQELLNRYGKPTAIYFLPDSPPTQSQIPKGMGQFSPGSVPGWAQPVLIPLTKGAGKMAWLYKTEKGAVSYVIDRLGYVECAVAVGTGPLLAANGKSFEFSRLTQATLGVDARKVLFHYGYPDEIRSHPGSVTECVYWPKEKRKAYEPVFATVFTLRNNRVARVYSYEDYLHAKPENAFDKGYKLILHP